jgi:type II secretory pathway pseudopilin PulG
VKSKTKNGFVLIELLLSLTIMTLLFGVSLKAYQYIRETTRSAQASEEASKIRKVFETYLETYGCWPKGIFPIEQWFDLSRKKLDFKTVFSGRNKNTNPEGINFIQQVGLKEDALKKPLWIFLCNPWSQQIATIALPRLAKLRNRPNGEKSEVSVLYFPTDRTPTKIIVLCWNRRLNASTRKTKSAILNPLG